MPVNLFTERARVASLTRSREANDPALLDARRRLATDRLAQYIERTLAAAPPLTAEQHERIAAALKPYVAKSP